MTGSLRLADLLRGVEGARVRGDAGVVIAEVRDDSRQVAPGDLFVATPGTQVDGRRFVAAAVARGAVAVVTEGEVDAPGVLVTVPSARQALGVIAANRYGAAQALELVALTGTNGKTTTTYLVEAILAAAGRRPGVLGTVSYRWGGKATPASLTTPGALALHGLFAAMRADAVTDVVLEASSIALDQGRLEGCRFRVAALTNVTQDHLDYHGTMERYFEAKAILFERLLHPDDGVGVTFADREDGVRMKARIRGRSLTVSLGGPADVEVRRRELTAHGIQADLATPAGVLAITSPLVGEYNLRNVALATAIGVAQGLAGEAIVGGLAGAQGAPGRLERVANARGVLCLVDYAHTPDALERALAAVRPLARGRLVVVFGCGGDRDRSKRAVMGALAARGADLVIVTSDNPRTEDPASIVEMIVEGVRKEGASELSAAALPGAVRGFHVEVDRRLAIRRAAAAAQPGDAVLIAGKGHEDYQILGTGKIHLDDREEAAAAFAEGDR